jgi:hypothetical protein
MLHTKKKTMNGHADLWTAEVAAAVEGGAFGAAASCCIAALII